jgi:hypothetical protein
MAVILKHLGVVKITWGHFKVRFRGAGRPYLNWCGEHCVLTTDAAENTNNFERNLHVHHDMST